MKYYCEQCKKELAIGHIEHNKLKFCSYKCIQHYNYEQEKLEKDLKEQVLK